MGFILNVMRVCFEIYFFDMLWDSFNKWFVVGGLVEEVDEKILYVVFILFGDILDI